MSILIQLAIAAGIAVAGFGAGVKFHAGLVAQRDLDAQINVRATERLRRQNVNTVAIAYENDKVRVRTEFVPITTEVEKIVTQTIYRDRACLTDDGLHAINAAVARANGVASKPRSAVSGPAGTE